ncbi:VOC family protein [Methylobacterium oxalidis]|uniref:VOC family protein n=1 Tax=Methylobacterium oxalidis TaxID=944322 RepID=UPI003314CB90
MSTASTIPTATMPCTISTCLWFDGEAEEAARFYVSLLPDSAIESVVRASVETQGGGPGSVMVVAFRLAGRRHIALNGGPAFSFTPAISLSVECADQTEIDRLWEALCAEGAPSRCGWLTDRYGLSWQIVPRRLGEMMQDPDAARTRRVTEALLGMTKLDLPALEQAYAD